MITLSISNRKGGTGKSTTALALAAGFARKGLRVLAIDLDPQQNMSQAANAQPGAISIFKVLEKNPQAELCDTIQHREDYDLISGDPQLAGLDIELSAVLGREHRLKEALQEVKDSYDLVILDTPPQLGTIVMNALTASDYVLIPAQADAFSEKGIIDIYQTVVSIRKYSNADLKLAGILMTRYNARTKYSAYVREQCQELAGKIGTKVLDTFIRENTAIKEAAGMCETIFDYDNNSNGAKDYQALIDELEGIIRG